MTNWNYLVFKFIFRDLRPSRIALWILLLNELSKINGKKVLDAASASFYTRPFYKHVKYVGIDNDKERVAEGVKHYKDKDGETFGVIADLKNYNFMDNCFDICVSTNTLYKFNIKDRIEIINKLVGYISEGGHFLVQIPIDDSYLNIISILKKRFSKIKIRFHKNRLSKFIETKFVEKEGWATENAFNRSIIFMMIKWMMVLYELVTSRSKKTKCNAFIICHKKKA